MRAKANHYGRLARNTATKITLAAYNTTYLQKFHIHTQARALTAGVLDKHGT
jgi:hypothetical protein